MTECKLDLKRNCAVCTECGEDIDHVSSFAKQSMRLNKDVIEAKKRAFSFKCETCDEMVQVCYENSRLVGKDCPKDKGSCLINITESMKNAVKEFGDKDE